ncbi:MAG TPA: 1-deoxy-D-xylulose-5-phosphate synthase N-terminal domain-containing protein, partial [Candidatus Pacearchaeota archaeon]|nr:1-deoxy-D-xylulose-5-phosphate synthase N-terminal domain-containing protein [Candidatus Pacearchaeota archaeon]
MNKPDYKKIANDARIRVLEMIYKAQTSHIGSNYSCIDLLAVIFEKADLNKDKVVLSKGWAAASLYYFLKEKGRITETDLESYCQTGSKFIGLAEPIIPDIPAAGGSMGFGLPFGVGFALAKKTKKEAGKIFVLMSDGEMQIGTTWESALIAAHHKLDNLLVFVDVNGLQAMG